MLRQLGSGGGGGQIRDKYKLPPGHSSQEQPHNKFTLPYFKVLNTLLSI